MYVLVYPISLFSVDVRGHVRRRAVHHHPASAAGVHGARVDRQNSEAGQ